MNLLGEILPWALWLIGLLGVGGAILFIMFVPGGLTLLVEFFRPWFKLLGEATAQWVRNRWEGLKDMFDNWKTAVTAATMVAIAFGAGYYYRGGYTCPAVSAEIREDYKLVKRTAAEKKAYLKKTGSSDLYVWWKTWF